jgi:hypothetical protein
LDHAFVSDTSFSLLISDILNRSPPSANHRQQTSTIHCPIATTKMASQAIPKI